MLATVFTVSLFSNACSFSQTDVATYVHRVGRTGRGGREGEAITFFSEDDAPATIRAVANVVKLSGGHVPPYLLELRKQRRDKRRGGGGGGAGRGGGHGGGGRVARA